MVYDLRPMVEPTNDPILYSLREQISNADRDLVAAFVRRLEAAAEVRSHKDERGYAFVDPERERELLAHWQEAAAGAVSDDALRELFETVLSLSKREAGRYETPS